MPPAPSPAVRQPTSTTLVRYRGDFVDEIAAALGVTRAEVARIWGAGLIDWHTPGHDARCDVAALARRPHLDVTALGQGAPVIALSVGPAMPDSTYPWRKYVGIDLANRQQAGEYERTLAWTTGWDMHPSEARAIVGGIVLASVSGFLSSRFAMRVLAFDTVNSPEGRRVRLFGVPLEAAEAALVDGTRAPTAGGPPGTWAPLAPTSPVVTGTVISSTTTTMTTTMTRVA